MLSAARSASGERSLQRASRANGAGIGRYTCAVGGRTSGILCATTGWSLEMWCVMHASGFAPSPQKVRRISDSHRFRASLTNRQPAEFRGSPCFPSHLNHPDAVHQQLQTRRSRTCDNLRGVVGSVWVPSSSTSSPPSAPLAGSHGIRVAHILPTLSRKRPTTDMIEEHQSCLCFRGITRFTDQLVVLR